MFMFMSLLAFVLSNAGDSCERFQIAVDANLASFEEVEKAVRKLRGDDFDIRYTIEPRAEADVDMMLHFQAGASGEILVTRSLHDGMPVPTTMDPPTTVTMIDGEVSMSIATRALTEFNIGCGDDEPEPREEPGVNSDANPSPPVLNCAPVINIHPPNPTNNPAAAQNPIPRDADTLGMVAAAVTVPMFVTGAVGFISASVLASTNGDEKVANVMLGIGIGSSIGVIIGASFGFAALHSRNKKSLQQKAKAKNNGVVLVPSVTPRRGGAQLGFTLRF
jgi:hypothetical protein